MDRGLAHGRVAAGTEERLAHVVAVLCCIARDPEAHDWCHRCHHVGEAEHLFLRAPSVGSRIEALRDDARETCWGSQDAQVMSGWVLDRSHRRGPERASESMPARQPLAASADLLEHRRPFRHEASAPSR